MEILCGEFDMVVSNNVLEHLEGPHRMDLVSAYVERDLRKYLQRDIPARGVSRPRWEQCAQEFLVAHSCKGRGVCAACNARCIVVTAAHLVGHVFLAVAMRQ